MKADESPHPHGQIDLSEEPSVLRVLLVEDNKHDARILIRALDGAKPPCDVTHCVRAEDAIQLLDAPESVFDVIVSDLNLPGVHGLEFCTNLRREKPNQAIVILTGSGSEHMAVQALKAGVDDYLIKDPEGNYTQMLSVVIAQAVRNRQERIARERAEEALAAENSIRATLVEALPYPTMLIRGDRTVVFANRVAREVGAVIGGLCWRDFGHSDYISAEHKTYINSHKKIPSGGTHCTFCLADDALDHSKAAVAPEIHAFGRIWETHWIPVGEDVYLHYALDITERRKTEEKHTNIIQASRDGFCIVDPRDAEFVEVNDSLCEMLGYSREELLAMRIADVEVAESPDEVRAHVREIMERGYANFETRHRRKDGVIIDVEVSMQYMPDSGLFVSFLRDITGRKQTERALGESEQIHRSLTNDVLDSSEVGIVILNAEFRVVWLNKAIERYFGVRREDAVGKDKRQLIQDRIRSIFESPDEFCRKVLATYDNNTYVENFECHVLSDGERQERWLHHWSQPIQTGLYAGGRIEHYYDVTERRRAEEALRDEKLLSEDYINSLPSLFYVFDEQRFVRWNTEWNRVTGCSDEELAGKYGADFFEGEDRTLIEERMLEVFREGAADAEAELVTRDGRRIPYYFTGVRKELNGKDHLIGSGIDITKRKQAEESLKESEQRFRDLAELLPQTVYEADLEGRLTFVNRNAFEMFGYSREDVEAGLSALDVLASEDHERARQNMECIVRGEGLRGSEYVARRKDGSQFPVVIHSTRILEQNRPTGLRGIIVDISEHKRTEQSLREAEKHASIGRIAAQVAHEINNPLAGIKNSFRLIQDAVPDDHPDRDMVERIDREIDRIAYVVRQMYTLYSPAPETLVGAEFADALHDVLMTLEPLRRKREVAINVDGVPEELIVRLPKGTLHQILQNLLANAIEASVEGQAVNVAAKLTAAAIRISVRDQGRGISPELREHIFEPFFTSKTDESSEKGMGLGLSTVKNAVESLNGRIELESTPGQGTVFHVFLPRELVIH